MMSALFDDEAACRRGFADGALDDLRGAWLPRLVLTSGIWGPVGLHLWPKRRILWLARDVSEENISSQQFSLICRYIVEASAVKRTRIKPQLKL